MAKSTTQYVCQTCGATSSKWAGRCTQCGSWDSFIEQRSAPTAAGRRGSAVVKPIALADVEQESLTRFTTGVSELDRVLGDGVVPGSLVLLSGDPGVGKSTLVLQVASTIAAKGKVLYVSGEESARQIKLRADRMSVAATGLELMPTTSAADAADMIQTGGYDLAIIDSIQTLSAPELPSAPGSPSQITTIVNQLMAAAKSTHTACIIIGHVTKEGTLAGPKLLEHLVDVVLSMEGDQYGSLRVVKASKNRFGATSDVALLEMGERGFKQVENPSKILLAERRELPGSAVFVALEGTRPLMVEVQALVSPSVLSYPKRAAVGVDQNRLSLLAAVLTKRAGLPLSDQDIYVSIVGGLKITEPAIDLALILAIASAYYGTTIPGSLASFGEVGLAGEIRSVQLMDARAREARKLGFHHILAPAALKQSGVVGITDIATALTKIKSSSSRKKGNT
ncbi:MAG: DNA repair protein RadA [Candidatus Saccharibacteria bacterium]|jgi:DNA repair protein RadA/Sms